MCEDEFVIKADGLLEGKNGLWVGGSGGLEGTPQGQVSVLAVLRPLALWQLLEPMLLVLELSEKLTMVLVMEEIC